MTSNSNTVPGHTPKVVVLAMYRFVHLPDYVELRERLLESCKQNNLFGTLLLAEEGLNGTIAGSRMGVDQFLRTLQEDVRFADMQYRESLSDSIPFHRMKVKLKKEIVSMGISSVRPGELTGKRVEPENWNALISDPGVLVIDTRNNYEVDIGAFKNATSPGTETFREFPTYVDQTLKQNRQKKIAMYCTGGIRCEKASAYLLEQGFEDVYQLHGGILNYLEKIKPEESLWQGECFVFDGRVAVDGDLKPGAYHQCYACRRPVSPEQMQSKRYVEGISCPHCYNNLSAKKRDSLKERQKQVELAESRNMQHIGVCQRK